MGEDCSGVELAGALKRFGRGENGRWARRRSCAKLTGAGQAALSGSYSPAGAHEQSSGIFQLARTKQSSFPGARTFCVRKRPLLSPTDRRTRCAPPGPAARRFQRPAKRRRPRSVSRSRASSSWGKVGVLGKFATTVTRPPPPFDKPLHVGSTTDDARCLLLSPQRPAKRRRPAERPRSVSRSRASSSWGKVGVSGSSQPR